MASIVVNGDTSGAVTLSAPAVAGTVTVTLPTTTGTMLTTASSTGISGSAISSGTVPEAYGGTGTSTGYYGFKNRIINGAMVIDQRNGGASINPTDGQGTVDQWRAARSQASKLTVQQNAGAVTPPVGFSNYLGVTSSSAYTVLAADYFFLFTKIEGFNFADMAWGTANAQTVTISFWVYSSLTGTFGGSVLNSAQNRSYPFTYTINAANTWEKETITIAGDTSGTWIGATNGTGLQLYFGLGVGSTGSGTAGAWAAAGYQSATGATSVVGTNGATFFITGVQLEKGSTATSFDYRPFGTELALCQRYFYKANGAGNNGPFGFGYYTATTEAAIGVPFPIVMRSIPTFTSSAANTFLIQDSANRTPTAITMQVGSVSYASIIFTLTGATAGNGTKVLDNGVANLAFASEL